MLEGAATMKAKPKILLLMIFAMNQERLLHCSFGLCLKVGDMMFVAASRVQ